MNEKSTDITFEDKVSKMFDILVSNPGKNKVLINKDSVKSFMNRDYTNRTVNNS